MQDDNKGTDQVTEPSLPAVETSGQTDTPATLEIEKLKKEYESKLAIEKAQASGSTRAFNEMKKQLEEMQKTSMTDKERAEYDRKKAESDRIEFENDKRKLEQERVKFKYIATNQIDSRFETFLTAETEDGLKEQIETLKSLIEVSVKPFKDELEKLKAELGRPGGGTGAAGTKSIEEINSLPPKERAAYFAAGGVAK